MKFTSGCHKTTSTISCDQISDDAQGIPDKTELRENVFNSFASIGSLTVCVLSAG
jgi:hypothetical protein